MATPIGSAPSYYTDFTGGQGAGVSNYFTYDADLDTNFSALKTTVNQIIVEISALSGPNAVAALDAILWDDAANPISGAEQTYGVVGAGSYEVSVEGGGTLKVTKGPAFVNGQRVSLPSDLTGLTSSGGAGTRWVAIDANGAVSIQSLAAQKSLDIASVTWNGTIFTGSPTHLADVFFDGDSWAELRDRTAAGTSFPAFTFRRASERIEEIEQSLSAAAGGAAVLAMPPGLVTAPGLIFSDGVGGADTGTGFWRQAANVIGFAASGAGILRFRAQGLRCVIAGSVGTPVISRSSDTGSGLYFITGGPALAASGTQALRALTIAQGGVGLPLLLRVQATQSAGQSLGTSATPAAMLFDSENYDVGTFHDTGSNTDQFVVPANGGGSYRATLNVVFSESTSSSPNTGDREVRISVGGTEVESVRVPAAGAGDSKLSVSVEVDLVATDIVRGEAAQDSGGAMDVDARLTLVRVA